MAQVKIEEIIEHLSSEIRKALEVTLEEISPHTKIDPYDLFRAFRRAVGRKCNEWEQVPDRCVRK